MALTARYVFVCVYALSKKVPWAGLRLCEAGFCIELSAHGPSDAFDELWKHGIVICDHRQTGDARIPTHPDRYGYKSASLTEASSP